MFLPWFPLFAKDAVGWYNKGIDYYNNGKFEKAIECYTKAIEIDPDIAWVYYNRGLVYEKMGRDSDAQADFKKACDMGDEDACEKMK